MPREILERPAVVGRGGGTFRQRFAVPDAGQAVLFFRSLASGLNWGKSGYESGTLRVEFDGYYSQHVILFGGSEEVIYPRFVGMIGVGPHEVMFTFSPEGSSPQASWLRTVSLEIDPIGQEDPRYYGIANSPIIWGRAERGTYEMHETDTPLFAFYRFPKGGLTGREIEYYLAYSHLDKDMDPAQRLSQTGTPVPMQWSFRGSLDSAGRMLRNLAFQGRNHGPHTFTGSFDLQGHPVLQAVGTDGIFADKVTTPYRLCVPALDEWTNDQPIAAMSYKYPWSYRIAAQELGRQGKIEKPGNPDRPALSDLRDYLFLHFGRSAAEGTRTAPPVEVLVHIDGRAKPLSSTFGNNRWLVADDKPFATAVKLPPSTPPEAVRQITVRAVPQRRDPFSIEITGPRAAFFLGPNYQPGPMLAGAPSDKAVHLTNQAPEATIWEATP